jgi:hypothetical protein
VARHIFQACPVWIYTQSNITSKIFKPRRKCGQRRYLNQRATV